MASPFLPLSPAGAARAARPARDVHLVCRACGSPNVSADAVARWDFSAQAWSMAGVMDDRTCDDCGSNGASITVAIEDALLTSAQSDTLVLSADFDRTAHDAELAQRLADQERLVSHMAAVDEALGGEEFAFREAERIAERAAQLRADGADLSGARQLPDGSVGG